MPPTTVTLNEMAKVAKTPMAKAIILNLLRQSPLLRFIPVKTVSILETKGVRWSQLPNAGTRKIGGSWTPSTGTTEETKETLFVYGGEFGIDRILTLVDSIENPLKTQVKMKIAATAARFNYDFIANDHTVDPDGFEGLSKRVSNKPARMTINLETAGDTLKVYSSAATLNTFLDALHALLHRLGASGGENFKDVNIALFMNEAVKLAIQSVYRRSGLLSTQTDAYGRTWDTFGPAKLIDVGLKGDQSTEIITSTETAGDAGADSTSIYGVRFGAVPVSDASGKVTMMEDDGVKLLQLAGTELDMYDPYNGGESPIGSAPAKGMRLEWAIGLEDLGSYSVARLKGFTMSS